MSKIPEGPNEILTPRISITISYSCDTQVEVWIIKLTAIFFLMKVKTHKIYKYVSLGGAKLCLSIPSIRNYFMF